MKKGIFIFISIFLFTACAERGSLLELKVTQKTVAEHIDKKDDTIPTLVLRQSTEDVVQKSVSGGLIIIIGLILFL